METLAFAERMRHPRFRRGGFSPSLHSPLFPQRRRAAALRTSCGNRYTAEAKGASACLSAFVKIDSRINNRNRYLQKSKARRIQRLTQKTEFGRMSIESKPGFENTRPIGSRV